MEQKLAVDFGTTNSLVARWNDEAGAAEVLSIVGLSAGRVKEAQRRIPSLLYIRDGRSGQAAVGQSVIESGLDRGSGRRLFRNFKRGITVGQPAEPRFIDGVPWTDYDAGQCFLRELAGAIPLEWQEISELVITVPVAAFEGYAAWLGEALGHLPLDRVRIVDESTAAALGYALIEPGAVVLVADLGGGSLDLSLVRLPASWEKAGGLLGRMRAGRSRWHSARVIAKAGATLGGSDIDYWIMGEVLERAGLLADHADQDRPRLMMACEQAKIALSTSDKAVVAFCAGDGQRYSVPLLREELEGLLEARGFYAALHQAVDRMMGMAHRQGVYEEDVECVLMVGGVSLMPSVQAAIEVAFPDRPVRVDKPFTAVVEGALRLLVGYGLDDQLVHSYGLRHLDTGSGTLEYDEIIPAGSRYPARKSVSVTLQAAYSGQEIIEFVVGQIDVDAISTVEVQREGGRTIFVAQADRGGQQIASLNARGEAPASVRLDPPGTPGVDRLRAGFTVDEQRRLRLSVVDLQTSAELLDNAVVASLGTRAVTAGSEQGNISRQSTGREPCLASYQPPGRHRLSLRGVASMLDLLPPDSISLGAVAAALYSPDCTARYTAAEVLSKRGDRDARRIMEEVLDRGTAPQRASVARHLHRLSWYGSRPLLQQALCDEDERVRAGAVFALCRMRTSRAYKMLDNVLPGEGDSVRMEAARTLENSRDARAVPILEIVLCAEDPRVRQQALQALAGTEAPEALPTVRGALDDEDLDVRYHAGFSMVELAEDESLGEMAELIKRTRGPEREQVLRALFHATNYLQLNIARSRDAGVVIEALVLALGDDRPETRVAAAMPLMRMADDRAATALREGYFQEQDGGARARMLYYAVLLNSPTKEEFLHDGLRSADEQVRETAHELAAYLGSG